MKIENSKGLGKREGILSVMGGICIHLVIGAFYLWGSINVYLTSYYRSTGSNPTLSLSLAAIVMPFMDLTFTIGNMIGVSLQSKLGLRKTCFLSVVSLSLSSFLAGCMPNFWLFVVLYGGLFGVWSGVLYCLPIFNAFMFFPSKRGFISGTILGAFGFGSLISSLIATKIINPDNASPILNPATNESYFEPHVAERALFCIKILSLYFFIMGSLGVLFLSPYEALLATGKGKSKVLVEPKQVSDGRERLLEPLEMDSKNLNEAARPSAFDLMKKKEFSMIAILMILPSGLGYLIANNFKNYGQTFLRDDHFLTTTGSVASAFGGVARIFWGALYDKLGFTFSFRSLLCILILVGASLEPLKEFRWIYMTQVCLSFACLGGLYVLLPPLCEKIYGEKMGATMFSILFFGFVLSDWIQFLVILFGSDNFGYESVFWVYTCLNAILLFLSFLFRRFFVNI